MPPWSIVHSRCWKGRCPTSPATSASSSSTRAATAARGGPPRSGVLGARVRGRHPRGDGRERHRRGRAGGLVEGRPARAARGHRAPGARCSGSWWSRPALPLGPATDRAAAMRAFLAPQVSDEGWGKWNIHHWRRDYEDFLEFFFGKVFPEPHSTKQIEDVDRLGSRHRPGDAGGDGPDRGVRRPRARRSSCAAACAARCSWSTARTTRSGRSQTGRELAAATGARFVAMPGCGHAPHVRKPVFFNALLKGVRRAEARAPPLAAASTDSTKGDSQ